MDWTELCGTSPAWSQLLATSDVLDVCSTDLVYQIPNPSYAPTHHHWSAFSWTIPCIRTPVKHGWVFWRLQLSTWFTYEPCSQVSSVVRTLVSNSRTTNKWTVIVKQKCCALHHEGHSTTHISMTHMFLYDKEVKCYWTNKWILVKACVLTASMCTSFW